VPDQAVLAARCSIVPSIEDSPDVIQVGDTAQVKSGPHTGMQGIVEFVQHTPGIVRLRCLVPSCHIHVPISSVTFTPPVAALRFSAARNYDVRTGESVVVVRGNYIGRSGVVSKVDLDRKTLDVASTWNPSVCGIVANMALLVFY
jgi:ribosomal protein L24